MTHDATCWHTQRPFAASAIEESAPSTDRPAASDLHRRTEADSGLASTSGREHSGGHYDELTFVSVGFDSSQGC